MIYHKIFEELERFVNDIDEEVRERYAEIALNQNPEEGSETVLDNYREYKEEFKLLKKLFLDLLENNPRAYTEPLEQIRPILESS